MQFLNGESCKGYIFQRMASTSSAMFASHEHLALSWSVSDEPVDSTDLSSGCRKGYIRQEEQSRLLPRAGSIQPFCERTCHDNESRSNGMR